MEGEVSVADISRYPEDIWPLASLTLRGASSERNDVNPRESVGCDRGGDQHVHSGESPQERQDSRRVVAVLCTQADSTGRTSQKFSIPQSGVDTRTPLHLRGGPNYPLEKARPEGALRTGKGMIPGDLHELKIKDQMS